MKKQRPREQKDFSLELKSVDDGAGTFTGYLSVFNVLDLGKDIVEPGAFKKTITEQGGCVPMLWQHKSDQIIGMLYLEEDSHGLRVTKGDLFTDELEKAREAYGIVKRFHAAGKSMGMSIGYEDMMTEPRDKNGIRRLKQLRLLEGSLVTFAMCQEAQTDGVKADITEEELKVGRRISAITRDQIAMTIAQQRESIQNLEALLTDDDATNAEADVIEEPKAATQEAILPDPLISEEIHLLLRNFKFQL